MTSLNWILKLIHDRESSCRKSGPHNPRLFRKLPQVKHEKQEDFQENLHELNELSELILPSLPPLMSFVAVAMLIRIQSSNKRRASPPMEWRMSPLHWKPRSLYSDYSDSQQTRRSADQAHTCGGKRTKCYLKNGDGLMVVVNHIANSKRS